MPKEVFSRGVLAETLGPLITDYLDHGEHWMVIGSVHDKKTIGQIIQAAHELGIRLPKEALNFLQVSFCARDRDLYLAGLILQLVGLRNSQVRERHTLSKQAGGPSFLEGDVFLRWACLVEMGAFDPEELPESSVVK